MPVSLHWIKRQSDQITELSLKTPQIRCGELLLSISWSCGGISKGLQWCSGYAVVLEQEAVEVLSVCLCIPDNKHRRVQILWKLLKLTGFSEWLRSFFLKLLEREGKRQCHSLVGEHSAFLYCSPLSLLACWAVHDLVHCNGTLLI